jgi:hypothetical protein
MRWFHWPDRHPDLRPADHRPGLATPIDELDPTTLEVVEVDAAGRLRGLPRWPDDDSLRETAYAAAAPDGTSSRGIWTALGNT